MHLSFSTSIIFTVRVVLLYVLDPPKLEGARSNARSWSEELLRADLVSTRPLSLVLMQDSELSPATLRSSTSSRRVARRIPSWPDGRRRSRGRRSRRDRRSTVGTGVCCWSSSAAAPPVPSCLNGQFLRVHCPRLMCIRHWPSASTTVCLCQPLCWC